jgi:hypothetical protein
MRVLKTVMGAAAALTLVAAVNAPPARAVTLDCYVNEVGYPTKISGPKVHAWGDVRCDYEVDQLVADVELYGSFSGSWVKVASNYSGGYNTSYDYSSADASCSGSRSYYTRVRWYAADGSTVNSSYWQYSATKVISC